MQWRTFIMRRAAPLATAVSIFLPSMSLAQSANDLIRLFGGVMQNAIIQSVQTEWKRLPPSEIACVDRALRLNGMNLATVVQQGMRPDDPRVADVRVGCRTGVTQENSGDLSLHYVANTRPPDAFLSLRTLPSSNSGRRLMTMSNGTVLQVLQRQDDGWWQVRVVSTGQQGWALSGTKDRNYIVCCATSAMLNPSFPCARATFPDERAICSNIDLANLDRRVASGYDYIRRKYGDAYAKATNTPLFQARRACRADVTCIREKQIAAIDKFRSLGAPNEPSPEPAQLLWDHNGSTVYLVAKGRSRMFHYRTPRPGMLDAGASPDALLFEGEAVGERYQGTAYIFKSPCGKFAYQVSGPILDGYRRVELRGQAPRVNQNCQIIDYFEDLLTFELIQPIATPPSGNETVTDQTPTTPKDIAAASPNQSSMNPSTDVATIVKRIQEKREAISENVDSLRDDESRQKVRETLARIATANSDTPVSELNKQELDADLALKTISDAEEFGKVSAIADGRMKVISAVLDRITSDAPIIKRLQGSIKLLRDAQNGSSLTSLQSALRDLNALYEGNRVSLQRMEFDAP